MSRPFQEEEPSHDEGRQLIDGRILDSENVIKAEPQDEMEVKTNEVDLIIQEEIV